MKHTGSRSPRSPLPASPRWRLWRILWRATAPITVREVWEAVRGAGGVGQDLALRTFALLDHIMSTRGDHLRREIRDPYGLLLAVAAVVGGRREIRLFGWSREAVLSADWGGVLSSQEASLVRARTDAFLATMGLLAHVRWLAREARVRSTALRWLILGRTTRPLAFLDRVEAQERSLGFWQPYASLARAIVLANRLAPGAPIQVTGPGMGALEGSDLEETLGAMAGRPIRHLVQWRDAARPEGVPDGVVIHVGPLPADAWRGVPALARFHLL